MTSLAPPIFTPHPMNEDYIMRKLNFTEDMYDFISMESAFSPTSNVPCVDAFHSIGQSYKHVHGYIALCVCIFGTLANSLNLVILIQKDMRTPINLILCALALVDVLVMLEYIPFAIHMYILQGSSSETEEFSYPWALFVLFHSHFTQILHTMAIQLTLTMAIWRYVAIRFTNQYQVNAYCTFRRCFMAIGAAFILPFFICIPNYLTFSVVQRQTWAFRSTASLPHLFRQKEAIHLDTLLNFCRLLWPNEVTSCRNRIIGKSHYVVDLSDLAKARGGLLHIIHFWTFSVLVKLLPCVVLTFFMVYLLHTLYAAKQRHKVLQLTSAIPLTPVRNQHRSPDPISKDFRSCDPISKDLKSCNPREQLLPDVAQPKSNGHLTLPTDKLVGFTEASRSCRPSVEEDYTGVERLGSCQILVHAHPQKKWYLGWRKTSSPVAEHAKKAARRSERTSRMLVAVLCLFVLTEFPQGIMAFLSGLYGAEFFRKCYNAFAEIWDLLALVNSAVNFLLYCFMSRQFRIQFRKFFPVSTCFGCGKSVRENGNHKHTVHTTVV